MKLVHASKNASYEGRETTKIRRKRGKSESYTFEPVNLSNFLPQHESWKLHVLGMENLFKRVHLRRHVHLDFEFKCQSMRHLSA